MSGLKNTEAVGSLTIGCGLMGLLLVVTVLQGNQAPNVGIAILVLAIGFFVGLCLWTSASAHNAQLTANGKQQEEARRQEEDRIRNSPEEVAKRAQQAERARAVQEERERQRRAEDERRARQQWRDYHHAMRIEQTDDMSGVQFEQMIRDLLERTGYRKVALTPNNDQGADVRCESPEGKKVVVQTKRWQGPVGNGAVQEVLAAMVFYDAQEALVFTNSRYTDSAKALAAKDSRITLVDRLRLASMLEKAFPREVPEFNWDEYNRYVKNWVNSRPTLI